MSTTHTTTELDAGSAGALSVDDLPPADANGADAELAASRRVVAALAESARRRAGGTWWSLATLTGADDDRWWDPLGARMARRASGLRTRAEVVAEERTGRRHRRWTEVLAVGLCAFGVWLLFDAPTLLHSAEGSPLGARRTAAIEVLRPIAAVSRDLGLSHVVGAANRVLGRSGGSVVPVVGPPVHLHHHRHLPATHAPPAATTGAPQATDALPPLPSPSAAAPLRVLSVGDSLGLDFGGPFMNDLAASGVVNGALDARVDTGLSRPDYFDWPAELQADLARYQPQVVVVFLGANDPQNFVDQGTALAFGTPEWSAAYGRRVAQVMAEATSAGARVLWVGMPPMADPALTAKMQVLDDIFQSQAAGRPGVTYLSSWPVFAAGQGTYAQYLPDASGNQVAVREPDGTHISPGGGERLSQAVIAAMDHAWGLTLQP